MILTRDQYGGLVKLAKLAIPTLSYPGQKASKFEAAKPARPSLKKPTLARELASLLSAVRKTP